MRSRWILAGVCFVSWFWSGIAIACSCSPPDQRGASEGAVVTGTIAPDVDGVVESPFGRYTTRLIAEKVWFGPDQREFRLMSTPTRIVTTCGGPFIGIPGERIMVWMMPAGGGYFWTHRSCSVVSQTDEITALERDFRQVDALYADADRRLKDTPTDQGLWRRRLQLAGGQHDQYGRLYSLRHLIELTRRSDVDLLRQAIDAALKLNELNLAENYVEQALALRPADASLAELRRTIRFRLSYDQTSYAAAKDASRLEWSNIQGEIQLSGLNAYTFAIRRSHLQGQVLTSTLVGGIIEDTSLSGLRIRNGSLDSVLAYKVDFSRADMERSSLIDWRIGHSTFSDAHLRDTTVRAEIVQTSFKGAILEKVDFEDSEFTNVDFSGASLYGVRFDDTRLSGVNLSATASLLRTSWKGAVYDCQTRLPAALNPVAAGMIAEAGSCNGKPNSRDFTSEAYADIVKWMKLDLAGAKFAGSKVSGSFSQTILRGADLTDARIERAYFHDTDLRDARFNRAVIAEPMFSQSDLRGTDFSDVVFKIEAEPGSVHFNRMLFKSRYDARTKWPATYVDSKGAVHPFNPARHEAVLVKD